MANYLQNEISKFWELKKKGIKYKQKSSVYININYKIKEHVFVLVKSQ